ncbi:MAG: hypothetical protein JW937_00740 [Candidatus Omnitrophica bacterium]|nr:hypothetical protein [Candidatus Omnitrophota bacterium]
MKTYDFALNWGGTIKEKFVDHLQAVCKQKNLSMLWITEENVRQVIRDLEEKNMRIKVCLDGQATYHKKGDPYARVCYAAKDAGGMVINDPDRTQLAVNKAAIYYELTHAGVLAPYTVVVRNWQPQTYRLPDEERAKLGVPFVIKPSLGFGQLGVIREAKGTIREIAGARKYDRGDDFLLQERIVPIHLNGNRAWFRVFNLFDTIIPCWWDDVANRYAHVSYEEFNAYSLYPLVKIVSKIAQITQMSWFSTEIAIDEKEGKRRFLAIDFVNDQCDMSAQSEHDNGVPDPVVEYTARRMIETTCQYLSGEKAQRKYEIWLKDATVQLRGLGKPPELLGVRLSSS